MNVISLKLAVHLSGPKKTRFIGRKWGQVMEWKWLCDACGQSGKFYWVYSGLVNQQAKNHICHNETKT